MTDLITILCNAGWRTEAAEVLAECFENDHPAVRIKAEPKKDEENVD